MLELRKPTVADVPAMVAMMAPHVTTERLLPRTPREVAERLRDYTLAFRADELVGLASVSLVDTHLAEVGAFATVDVEAEVELIEAVLVEVRAMGVERAFVMTNEGTAFQQQGFQLTTLETLPEKRDRQCLRCARLPRCRQVALEIRLQSSWAVAAK